MQMAGRGRAWSELPGQLEGAIPARACRGRRSRLGNGYRVWDRLGPGAIGSEIGRIRRRSVRDRSAGTPACVCAGTCLADGARLADRVCVFI